MIKIYGIKNCDTVKKALKWAEENKLDHQFHDFRKNPVGHETVAKWVADVGGEILVNKRGTTYRNLNSTDKEQLANGTITSLLVQQPTLMKRPIFDLGEQCVVGFKDKEKEAVLRSL